MALVWIAEMEDGCVVCKDSTGRFRLQESLHHFGQFWLEDRGRRIARLSSLLAAKAAAEQRAEAISDPMPVEEPMRDFAAEEARAANSLHDVIADQIVGTSKVLHLYPTAAEQPRTPQEEHQAARDRLEREGPAIHECIRCHVLVPLLWTGLCRKCMEADAAAEAAAPVVAPAEPAELDTPLLCPGCGESSDDVAGGPCSRCLEQARQQFEPTEPIEGDETMAAFFPGSSVAFATPIIWGSANTAPPENYRGLDGKIYSRRPDGLYVYNPAINCFEKVADTTDNSASTSGQIERPAYDDGSTSGNVAENTVPNEKETTVYIKEEVARDMLAACGMRTARETSPERLTEQLNSVVMYQDDLDLPQDKHLKAMYKRCLEAIKEGHKVVLGEAPESNGNGNGHVATSTNGAVATVEAPVKVKGKKKRGRPARPAAARPVTVHRTRGPRREGTGSARKQSIEQGTTLTREFKGETHKVRALADGGFSYNGDRYTSLTNVAKKITGYPSISGPVFFGLSKRATAES